MIELEMTVLRGEPKTNVNSLKIMLDINRRKYKTKKLLIFEINA